ncbi:MAG: type II secretion system protein N, partial [Janthinobacterium lividum]
MMRLWRHRLALALPWLSIGIVAVLLTLLTMLPAAWIVPQFARATGSRVMLVNPEGSLWHGTATLMLSSGGEQDAASAIPQVSAVEVAPAGPAPVILPGRVEWHTAFWPLFTAHLKLTMRQNQAMPQAVLLDASFNG